MDDFDESDPRVTIIKAFCIFFRGAGASLLNSVLPVFLYLSIAYLLSRAFIRSNSVYRTGSIVSSK